MVEVTTSKSVPGATPFSVHSLSLAEQFCLCSGGPPPARAASTSKDAHIAYCCAAPPLASACQPTVMLAAAPAADALACTALGGGGGGLAVLWLTSGLCSPSPSELAACNLEQHRCQSVQIPCSATLNPPPGASGD